MEKIGDLDIAVGIENCAGEELFYELLGDFYLLIETKANLMESHYREGKMHDLVVEVHALKSSARTIGALELSKQAYDLEMAGNEENVAFVEENLPALLEKYRSYREILSKYAAEMKPQEQEVFKPEQCKEQLLKIEDAANQFDLDTIDDIMKRLHAAMFEESLQDYYEKLRIAVADVDLEEVMKYARILAENI